MQTLAEEFNRQQSAFGNIDLFWLAFWAVAIDNDRQKRERKRRREDGLQRQARLRQEAARRAAPKPR